MVDCHTVDELCTVQLHLGGVSLLNLKDGLTETMNEYIPSKLTSKRHNLPWMNDYLRKEVRKKHKLTQKAKVMKNTKGSTRHLQGTEKNSAEKHQTSKLEIRKWDYGKITWGRKQQDLLKIHVYKGKKAWQHRFSGNQGWWYSTSIQYLTKAELLNKQFKSVFTKESKEGSLPPLSEPQYPTIPDINSVFCYDKHKKNFDIQFSLKRHGTV